MNRRDRESELLKSLREEGTQTHVGAAMVSIADDTDVRNGFHVLVDGELFGPVQAIK